MLSLFVEEQRAQETSGMVNPNSGDADASMRFAARIFRLMDEDDDGELTVEEFIKGFHKLKVQGNCYGDVTVTAFITERKLTKEDFLPKPAIPEWKLRRKSLRRGSSSVKLFNIEAKNKDDPEAKVNADKNRNDPEAKAAADSKENADQAAVFDASSIAAAAKAAAVISAKAKGQNMEDDEEPINFQGIRAASKFKAKAKLAKQKVRKIRRVWKIKAFW